MIIEMRPWNGLKLGCNNLMVRKAQHEQFDDKSELNDYLKVGHRTTHEIMRFEAVWHKT